MNLEIHKPELMRRVNAEIQVRHLHDADELLEQALDALNRQSPPPPAPPRDTGCPSVFEEGLGLFGSPEDAALLDEVVALAYAERRRPSKRPPPDL